MLEAQYEIIESCLKTKRKVDKSICVSDSDFTCKDVKEELRDSSDYVKPNLNIVFSDTPVLSSTKVDVPIPNFSCSLVDYDSSDDNSDSEFVIKREVTDDRNEEKTEVTNVESRINRTIPEHNENTQSSGQSDIINEITQRKFLKRKIENVIPNISKLARMESESSSRRKSSKPKKVEYHLGTKVETTVAPIIQNYTLPEENISEKLLNLPSDISVIREPTEPPTLSLQEPLQTCLLCEQQFFGPVPLTAHMYETHGIDLAQVFAAAQASQYEKPSPKKKIPNLVKISDVLSARKQLPQENYGWYFFLHITILHTYIIFILLGDIVVH